MEEICRFVNVHCHEPYYNLGGASFVLQKGELLGISCDSVATRQCIIDLLLNNTTPTSGHIQWSEQSSSTSNGRLISCDCNGLFRDLSVAENLSMTFYRKRFLYSARRSQQLIELFLKRFELDISPSTLVYKLPLLERYMLNMLCAANSGAQFLILSDIQKQVQNEYFGKLESLIQKLISSGMCIIIMDCYECLRLLTHSRILLFENNQLVRTLQSGIELFDFNQYRLKSADDDVQKQIPHSPLKEGSFINIRGIETQCIHSFDVCLRPGEIAYLIGKNRYEQEFLDALFGDTPQNQISYEDQTICSGSMSKLIKHGIGYFPRDINSILFPSLRYLENKTILILRHISRFNLVIRKSLYDFLSAHGEENETPKSIMAQQDYESRLSCCVQRYLLLRWHLLIINLPSVSQHQAEVKLLQHLIYSLAEKNSSVLVVVSSPSEIITRFDAKIEFDPQGNATKTPNSFS